MLILTRPAGSLAASGRGHDSCIGMWLKLKIALPLVACMAAPLLHAQRSDDADTADERPTRAIQTGSRTRLLSLNEGLAVLGAAMDMAHYPALQQDCSHFVHDIYDRAGFPYSYENSVGLFNGTDDFRRVARPQPGDLIVWRGHMGIIVNPVQHSFFSSLRTGFAVNQYDSRYWRKRGHPRFYRYVKAPSAGPTLASAKAHVTSESAVHTGEEESTEAPPSRSDSEVESDPSSTSSALHQPQPDLPLAVTADRATPEALRQALEEKFSDANTHLDNADLLNSAKPVVIVESFQIKKVRVKHDQGWAEVQMNESYSLSAGDANLQRRSEKQRWPLYRNGEQWRLESPTEAIYLPKETAVRLLAHELAAMTGRRTTSTHGTQQEAQLARLLDRLLGE